MPLVTTYQQLGKQLNGIGSRRRRLREKKRKTQKSGVSETAGGGVVDSCQMLIKAKERKTLVSPAEGVASRETAGLAAPPASSPPPPPPPHLGERAPGFLSRGSYDGGFTTYRSLSVVVVYEAAYASNRAVANTRNQLALGRRLGDRPARSAWRQWGIKKKGKRERRQVRNTAAAERLRHGSRCSGTVSTASRTKLG